MTKLSYGEKSKVVRAAMKISQQELASLILVHRDLISYSSWRSVSNWERGLCVPHKRAQLRIDALYRKVVIENGRKRYCTRDET